MWDKTPGARVVRRMSHQWSGWNGRVGGRARLLSLALVIALASLGSGAAAATVQAPVAAAQETIEVYELGIPGNYPNFPELLALFAQREPNVKIVPAPQQGGSGSTLARLKAEGENTQISLAIFGQPLGPPLRDA